MSAHDDLCDPTPCTSCRHPACEHAFTDDGPCLITGYDDTCPCPGMTRPRHDD